MPIRPTDWLPTSIINIIHITIILYNILLLPIIYYQTITNNIKYNLVS